jgi:PIN domain nuclease of toxin-antitoxin system
MLRRAFLDTQVAFWLVTGNKRLSASTLKAINASRETVVSAISLAELEQKALLGKLAAPIGLAQRFLDQGIIIESFGFEASEQLRRFPQLAKHDPFDRTILVQAASQFGTLFFTADSVLAELGLDWIVDCR